MRVSVSTALAASVLLGFGAAAPPVHLHPDAPSLSRDVQTPPIVSSSPDMSSSPDLQPVNTLNALPALVPRGGDKKYPYVPDKGLGKKLSFVWRSDKRSPEEIRRQGGFRTLGDYVNNDQAFDIGRHMHFADSDSGSEPGSSDYDDSDSETEKEPSASGFVSTAAHAGYAFHINHAVDHYVYLVHATPSMFVNDGVEDEVLAVGGILWPQVVGWYRFSVDSDADFPTDDELLSLMTWNPEYDAARWQGLLASPGLPQGWDHGHGAQSAMRFMTRPEIGGPVGFAGQFPLAFDENTQQPAIKKGGEPAFKRMRVEVGERECVDTQFGGHADKAFEAAYQVLKHKKAVKPVCQEPQPSTSTHDAAAACIREQHGNKADKAFAAAYKALDEKQSVLQVCNPVEDSELAADLTRHALWPQVQQLGINFQISSAQLVSHLDRGMAWLQQNHPDFYRAFLRQFPSVFSLLVQAYVAGTTISSCLPKGPDFGKRDVVPQLEARGNKNQQYCPHILAMVVTQPNVHVCKNDKFNLPCTDIQAPLNKCVNVPIDYENTISSLRPNIAAGTCTFYRNHNCAGESIRESFPGLDLYAAESDLQDAVTSLKCDNHPIPGPAPNTPSGWVWSPPVQKTLCSQISHLSIGFQLDDARGSGTYDTIKAKFLGLPSKLHTLAVAPSAGFHEWHDVDMRQVFGYSTVNPRRIRGLSLVDVSGGSVLGGDAWSVRGLKLKAQCAGSDIKIELDKFASLDRDLQWGQGNKVGDDYEVWTDDSVEITDWRARPACSHLSILNVNLVIADQNWAGTNNDLYVEAGQGSFLIARHPSRKEVFTTTVDLNKAYGSNIAPVANVTRISIKSKGGHDQVLPREIHVIGNCAADPKVRLLADHTIDEWISDGGKWNLDLTGESWIKKGY